MNTLETIAARHSYRGLYQNVPVPREHLKAILEAGCHAPSGCNKQTTSFIAVDDPDVMEQLFTVITRGLGKTAPAMICILTQKIIAYADRTFYIQDYSAAIENMLLAIHALGYASCWYEGHITDDDDIAGQLADAIGLPEPYRIACLLPVGVPVEAAKPPKKQSPDARMWFNRAPQA